MKAAKLASHRGPDPMACGSLKEHFGLHYKGHWEVCHTRVA